MKDYRIIKTMMELRTEDKSFTGKPSLFGFTTKYSQHEVRDIWLQAVEYGMELAFQFPVLDGKRVNMNELTPKQQKFHSEFVSLCEKYNCGIQFSNQIGATIVDLMPEIHDVITTDPSKIFK